MKKYLYIAASLLLTITMQAQDRPMPKQGPAPSINIKKPVTFVLENGLKVLVVENNKLPRVSYNLTLDNSPFAEGSKKGVTDLVSAMIGNATETISKDKFNEEIDFLGATINFYESGASANGLSRYSARILELLADGALNPLFTQADFDAERAKLIEGLKSDEKSTSAIAARVQNVLTFGKDHYSGEFTSEETLKNVTLQDVINHYNTYFVPANAYLVVIGDVKTKEVKEKVEQLFGADVWKKATAPNLTYNDPKDLQYSQINFVDVPNAVQSEIALVNLSRLKMNDKDYFAAILANQILGGGGEGRLFLNLREKHGWTYGSYSNIGAGKYISKFSSTASVRNTVTDSAVVEIFNELKKIRTDLVSAEDLRNAKAKYIGNFVMQIEKPATIARYALNIKTLGLPEDFYENYVKNINAVTPEDVRNAANKYFLANNTRVVIVGKAADVLPGLEAMSAKEKMPIFYFDKFGNKTEKPVVKKEIPAGVTAQSVIKKHVDAIGGEKALKTVKTLLVTSKGTIQGQSLDMISKFSSKGMSAIDISMSGMSMMKQVIGDKMGYQTARGQKKNIEDDELVKEKKEAIPFIELNLLSDKTIVLNGIETINGQDAYVIQAGTSRHFYDVKTGLRVASENESGEGAQKRKVITSFNDYVDVKGVKVPYKITLDVGMPLEFITQDVKINEGVTDKDFE
ncbi:insulinase family protein [Flavobacterium bernardetii]|uniref:Insulinase family protein n=1 Tax=Flavobacterium bernardetii TaxID=2813823 RepID=A0ABR7J0I6_9FLAO|nr:insulinase family protein [Flavobacterium bernardetii]MBC5835535.1 insulinase family protein [Flavobacterium bernardetii]